MLTQLQEMLKDAQARKYAIGCYNAINLDMVRGVIEAAEAEKSPVVICHAEVHQNYTPIEMIAPVMLDAAARAKVPVAVLLDHGKSFDLVIKAMKLGFNAVMYDGSSLSYDDNFANTKEIVKIAKPLGVCVEAELGHVTRPISGGGGLGDEEDSIVDNRDLYTDPTKALEFVTETGIDSLAIAYGTAHGVYVKKPDLDFDRLKKIRETVDVPLVMHGGTGLSDGEFIKSVQLGISKINYYTGMAIASAERLRHDLVTVGGAQYYHNLMMSVIESIREDVRGTMKLFGSTGKA